MVVVVRWICFLIEGNFFNIDFPALLVIKSVLSQLSQKGYLYCFYKEEGNAFFPRKLRVMPTYLIGLIILLTRQGGEFITSRYEKVSDITVGL